MHVGLVYGDGDPLVGRFRMEHSLIPSRAALKIDAEISDRRRIRTPQLELDAATGREIQLKRAIPRGPFHVGTLKAAGQAQNSASLQRGGLRGGASPHRPPNRLGRRIGNILAVINRRNCRWRRCANGRGMNQTTQGKNEGKPPHFTDGRRKDLCHGTPHPEPDQKLNQAAESFVPRRTRGEGWDGRKGKSGLAHFTFSSITPPQNIRHSCSGFTKRGVAQYSVDS